MTLTNQLSGFSYSSDQAKIRSIEIKIVLPNITSSYWSQNFIKFFNNDGATSFGPKNVGFIIFVIN